MRVILGGHWNNPPEGWAALSEKQQDITRRLNYTDGSVDVIFTEHVIEHIAFLPAIGFMRESLRVLKPGGIFRCAAPMTHVFTSIDHHPAEWMAKYVLEQMTPYYGPEIAELGKLGLGLAADPRPFLVDFLVRKHGHQFCWSGKLMQQVLLKIGFSDAQVVVPGSSHYDPTTCIERKIRGTHAENLERDFGKGVVFDPETGVVEARK